MYTAIDLTIAGPFATLTLNRPAQHNAFDAHMIAELRDAFITLANDSAVHVVVLTGAGKSFCAGGDANWMRATATMSQEQNLADAYALADMFDAAWRLPKPLLGRVTGAAIGGGAGLVACCDLVVATETARFGFGEVKLGLFPAVITQVVVPKIGPGHARALFVSGERFTAERAFEIGLIHAITTADDLDRTVQSLAMRLLSSGPAAVAATKRSLDVVSDLDRQAARDYLVHGLATVRAGDEAQEGLRAFLEKRSPAWVPQAEA